MPFAVALGWSGESAGGDAAATSARQAALAACVTAAGFPAQATPPADSVSTADDPTSTYAALFDPPDGDQASTSGYGIVDGIMDAERQVEAPTAFDRWAMTASPEEAAALEDVVAGCGATSDERRLDELAPDLVAMYVADPVTQTVFDAWAACMADYGYGELSDPSQARVLVLQEYFSPLPEEADAVPVDTITPEHKQATRELEIALAGADLACQLEHVRPAIPRLADVQRRLLDEAASGQAA